MGITIGKKAAAPAPEPEKKAAAPVTPTPKGGIKLGKAAPKPAPVSEEKVAEVKKGLTAQAKVTTDQTTKGKTVSSSEATEEVTGIPSTASALDHPEALCRVGVQAQYTHNLGNYNSTKIGVSLSVPCKHDEIEAVHAFTEEWVNAKMTASVEALQAPSE